MTHRCGWNWKINFSVLKIAIISIKPGNVGYYIVSFSSPFGNMRDRNVSIIHDIRFQIIESVKRFWSENIWNCTFNLTFLQHFSTTVCIVLPLRLLTVHIIKNWKTTSLKLILLMDSLSTDPVLYFQ